MNIAQSIREYALRSQQSRIARSESMSSLEHCLVESFLDPFDWETHMLRSAEWCTFALIVAEALDDDAKRLSRYKAALGELYQAYSGATPQARESTDAEDAERWRALCRNFGNKTDLATPGKKYDIVIKLNPDGCERYKPDGALDFAATLAAIMDDELRIQGRAGSSGSDGAAPASSVAREGSNSTQEKDHG